MKYFCDQCKVCEKLYTLIAAHSCASFSVWITSCSEHAQLDVTLSMMWMRQLYEWSILLLIYYLHLPWYSLSIASFLNLATSPSKHKPLSASKRDPPEKRKADYFIKPSILRQSRPLLHLKSPTLVYRILLLYSVAYSQGAGELFTRKFFADLLGKERKEKRENGKVKKENCKREGRNFKMDGEKYENEQMIFFFFFFFFAFHFLKPPKFVLGLPQ